MDDKTSIEAPKERRLHGDYWSTGNDGTVRLSAEECLGCGACYLPGIATCVACRSREFGRRTLASTGTLYTYTIVRGSGGVWPDTYAIGYVDFAEERVRVCGHLRETSAGSLRVGMTVGVEEAVLYADRDGTAVKCFRFRSAEAVQ